MNQEKTEAHDLYNIKWVLVLHCAPMSSTVLVVIGAHDMLCNHLRRNHGHKLDVFFILSKLWICERRGMRPSSNTNRARHFPPVRFE